MIVADVNWDDVYRGYVIREKRVEGLFVGPTSDLYRVKFRAMASRFTKKEAINYMQEGEFCKEGYFVIEDAT